MVQFLGNIEATGLSHFESTYYTDDIQGIYSILVFLGNQDSMGVSSFLDLILHEQWECNLEILNTLRWLQQSSSPCYLEEKKMILFISEAPNLGMADL